MYMYMYNYIKVLYDITRVEWTNKAIGLPSSMVQVTASVHISLGKTLNREVRGDDPCDSASLTRTLSRASGEVSLFIAGRLIRGALQWNFRWIFGVRLSAFSSLRMLVIEAGLRMHSATMSVMLARSLR